MKKQILSVRAKIFLTVKGIPQPKLRERLDVTWVYDRKTKKSKPRPIAVANEANQPIENNIQNAWYEYFANNADNLEGLLEFHAWKGPFAIRNRYFFPLPNWAVGVYDRVYLPDKPDGDNLDKMLNDALQDFVFKDDKTMVDWKGTKFGCVTRPRTETRILLLEDLKFDVESLKRKAGRRRKKN
jgi:Holliday junction resolvase RusA-like endonuclease